MKDETSADLYALEKKGLDRKTNHQDLMKTETKEIFVLTKAIGEKETVALKLEQSAKEVAQRLPPWRDKFRACQSGAKSEEQSHNRGGSMLWLASSYLEHEATIQEGVKKYHLCLSIPINSLFVGGSKRKGPFARQVLGCERYASLGRRRLHDPQFDDHSEQQDREWTSLDQRCHQQDCVSAFTLRH